MRYNPTSMGDSNPPGRPYVLISLPATVYYRADYQLVQFLGNVGTQSQLLDHLITLAAEPDKISTERAEDDLLQRATLSARAFQGFAPLVLEMLSCRAVDNYLAYISELLVLIFKTRPEALKSNEKVSVETILQYSTYDDLLDALTEEKVTRLSMLGMYKLDEHLRSHLKFALFENPESLQTAIRLIETRNLVVHNRGVINNRFIERVPSFEGKLGKQLLLDPANLATDLVFLQKSVLDIDFRAGLKFKIARTFPLWTEGSPRT